MLNAMPSIHHTIPSIRGFTPSIRSRCSIPIPSTRPRQTHTNTDTQKHARTARTARTHTIEDGIEDGIRGWN
jgi:hypothetical protein